MYPASLNRLRKKTRMLCKCCGDTLEDANCYMTQVGPKVYRSNCCRPCKRSSMATIRKLKMVHPRPPVGAPCECCGRIDKLQLDHAQAGSGHFEGGCVSPVTLGLVTWATAPKGSRRLWRTWPRQKSGKYARGHCKWRRGT
jgi:hypothetical protein